MKFSKKLDIQMSTPNRQCVFATERTACCYVGMWMGWSDGRWRASWSHYRRDHSRRHLYLYSFNI